MKRELCPENICVSKKVSAAFIIHEFTTNGVYFEKSESTSLILS